MATITDFSDLMDWFMQQNNILPPRTGSLYLDVENNVNEGFGVYLDSAQPLAERIKNTYHELYFYLTGTPEGEEIASFGVYVNGDDGFTTGYVIGLILKNVVGLTVEFFASQIKPGPTIFPEDAALDITGLVDPLSITGGWCKLSVKAVDGQNPVVGLYDRDDILITKQEILQPITTEVGGKIGIHIFNTSVIRLAGIDDWTAQPSGE